MPGAIAAKLPLPGTVAITLGAERWPLILAVVTSCLFGVFLACTLVNAKVGHKFLSTSSPRSPTDEFLATARWRA